MSTYIEVGGRRIGPGHPVFVVAEIGINHNGDAKTAERLIDAAAEANADAVKFQTYLTDNFVAKGNPYYDIFKKNELSDVEILRRLQRRAEKRGVVFFSSATDETGLARLSALEVPLYKISSANITNVPLLAKVAATGRPVIISTGGSTLAEVAAAEECLAANGAQQIAILHCTSLYPCPPENVHLNAIQTLQAAFERPIGFSDHSHGTAAAIASVVLGASIIEKHITLDRGAEGHDHHFSADPEELSSLVQGVRAVERMLGSPRIEPVTAESDFRSISRRYVSALVDIPESTVIEAWMVAPCRPRGDVGIAPAHMELVIGRRARRAIKAGESIRWEDV